MANRRVPVMMMMIFITHGTRHNPTDFADFGKITTDFANRKLVEPTSLHDLAPAAGIGVVAHRDHRVTELRPVGHAALPCNGRGETVFAASGGRAGRDFAFDESA